MRLTKHHGLGNDFLVVLPAAGEPRPDAASARRLCHRRLGVGADGLLVGVRPPEGPGAPPFDLVMTLYNADGSVAEMSGNGIRCLAHAEARRRGVAEADLDILTDAGPRRVAVRPGSDSATVLARVDMGPAKLLGPADDLLAELGATVDASPLAAHHVDMGNPHLVVHVPTLPPDDVLDRLGRAANGRLPDGVNVELVAAGPRAGELTMAVYERGVGRTLACGTGACATTAAAREWGLVGDRAVVHMPGGDVEVALDDTATLTGPSVHVATLEVDDG